MVNCNYIFLFVLCFHANLLSAQDVRFSKSYDHVFPDSILSTDFTRNVTELSNGDIVFINLFKEYTYQNSRIEFMKLNTMGDTTLTTVYGTDSIYYNTSSMIRNERDELVITLFEGRNFTPYFSKAGLIKYNKNGTVIWRNIDNQTSFTNISILDVIELSNKDYFTAGYVLNRDSSSTSIVYPADVYVGRTDSIGNLLWYNTFGSPDYPEFVKKILPTSDGGYLLAGYTRAFSQTEYDGNVIKIDSLGNKQWEKIYDQSAHGNVFEGGIQLLDGNYLLYGGTNQSGGLGYVVVINENGDKQWELRYRSSNTSYVNFDFWGAVSLPNDEIVLCGSAYCIDTSLNYVRTNNAFVLKKDANRQKIWEYFYRHDQSKDYGDHYLFDFKQTADGGFIGAGFTYIDTQDA